MSSSLPYICCLIDKKKILVTFEYWLWPYDLYKLSKIYSQYEAIWKSDARLNPERDGSRCYGRIGILWHKGIGAAPISGIDSVVRVKTY